MTIKIALAIVLFVFGVYGRSIAQAKIKWEDSLAISFLQKNEFGEKIGIIKDTVNGKIVISKNYYCYKSFLLKQNTTSTIFLINFGTFNTESSIYIAIVDDSNNDKKVFILGENRFDDDLERLNNYFKSKSDFLKEEYKIEITDLFLRCRRGQRKTPKYFH